MCKLLIVTQGRVPDEILRLCEEQNPHGMGVGYPSFREKSWIYSKGLSIDCDKRVKKFIGNLPYPHIIHFRLATSGGICPELTHPFPVKRGIPLSTNGSAHELVAHNGVWSHWDTIHTALYKLNQLDEVKGAIGDTRLLAWLYYKMGSKAIHYFEEAGRVALCTWREGKDKKSKVPDVRMFGAGWVKTDWGYISGGLPESWSYSGYGTYGGGESNTWTSSTTYPRVSAKKPGITAIYDPREGICEIVDESSNNCTHYYHKSGKQNNNGRSFPLKTTHGGGMSLDYDDFDDSGFQTCG